MLYLETLTRNSRAGWFPHVQTNLTGEKIWYRLGRAAVAGMARIRLDMDVCWQASLPSGPKIIAPNHPTTIDPFLMLTLFSEQVSILVTGAAFDVPVFGSVLRRSGHIPVVEGDGGTAFEEAKRLLAAGRTLVVFPEGSLSERGGGLKGLRTGAVRLALSTGAPIVPVGIQLDWERVHRVRITEKGRAVEGRLYWRGPYAITVGAPSYWRGDVHDRPCVRSMTNQLLRQIGKLCHQSAIRVEKVLQSGSQPVTRPLVKPTPLQTEVS